MRTVDLGAIGASASSPSSSSSAVPQLGTIDPDGLEYDCTDDGVCVRFLKDGRTVATLQVNFVDISFYAKQHLLREPPFLECGCIICSDGSVERFLIPTGRTRTAGNGSIAVKYYDASKPIKDEHIEQYERVGIRPPTGIFTYAFFEAPYLARSEDPRRGALFLIDPRMIILQYPMTDFQKKEFQTFGGKKVLYFDVLDAPNLQEREEEIKRCRMRGDEQKKQYEEADRKWEDEMEDRMKQKELEDIEKPKLSKKAKQKARQAAKTCNKGYPPVEDEEVVADAVAEAEGERLHKQKQAECRAKAEEDARREKEQEADLKKKEAAEVKRLHGEEEARMKRVKNLLQKVQSSLRPTVEAGPD